MKDGIYRIGFTTAQSEGAGVIVITGTRFVGGDSAMIYRGTYTKDGHDMTVRAIITRHSPGLASVLGVDNATLELTGTGDDAVARLKGGAREAPGVQISVDLRRIGDL